MVRWSEPGPDKSRRSRFSTPVTKLERHVASSRTASRKPSFGSCLDSRASGPGTAAYPGGSTGKRIGRPRSRVLELPVVGAVRSPHLLDEDEHVLPRVGQPRGANAGDVGDTVHEETDALRFEFRASRG